MEKLSPEMNKLSEAIIGAAMEVHRELGPGFAELTYHRALMIELEDRGIRFQSEVPTQLHYKRRSIGEGRLDLLVEGKVVVELKAAEANPKKYQRQAVAYLKATGLQLGLVINFEADLLKDGITRVIHTP